jgi:glucose-fructose oxidoreductase
MNLFHRDHKVRYAVVGLGWIAQESVLPAFTHADKNSKLVALVTDNHGKAAQLGQQYNVDHVISYDEYDDFLKRGQVDAVYIALPNNMHRDFTIRTARAHVHILCEKPMADTVSECQDMIRACEQNGVKLMIAYRLHFDPANLRAISVVNSGQIGEPRIFNSVFTQQVEGGNIRLKKSLGGGPLMDMGVYCINAARYLFRAEPQEVIAAGANDGEPRFNEVHEMASAVLRFPGERLATFTCSFGAHAVDAYEVIGTKGSIRLRPAYTYHGKMKLSYTDSENKQQEHSFSEHDQFGAELLYFSQCLLDDKDPEPGGREGMADLRVVEALLQSMRSRQAVKLDPYDVPSRPDERQKIELRPVKPPETVEVESPSGKT